MQLTTGNAIVDRMARVSMEGLAVNVIPVTWYKNITSIKTGKPYFAAIVILADLVYWYRPLIERDEYTGEICTYRKRFKGDLLQRDYSQLSQMFGLTMEQAREALKRLEQLKLAERICRDEVVAGCNYKRTNMYIKIYPDEIERISFLAMCESETDRVGKFPGEGGKIPREGWENSQGGVGKFPGEGGKIPIQTKITTENTTENTSSLIADKPLIDDAGPLINDEALRCLNNFDEEDINLFRVAMRKLLQMKSSSMYHFFGPALKEQLSRMNQSRREAMYRHVVQSYLEATRKKRIAKKIPYMMTCIDGAISDALAIGDSSHGISRRPDYNAMAMRELMEKLAD